jgi:hypothetical protein
VEWDDPFLISYAHVDTGWLVHLASSPRFSRPWDRSCLVLEQGADFHGRFALRLASGTNGLTLYRRLPAADARKEDRSSMIAVRIWTTHLAISLDFALPRKSKCSMAKPVGRLKAKNLRNASFTCLAHSARFPPPTLVEFLVPEVVPREASRLGPVAPPQCLLANGTQLAAPLSLLPLDSRGTSKERSKALAVALLEACFIARCRLYESSRQHLQPPTAKARGPAQQISGACVWRLKKLPGERVAVACRIRPG